MRYLALIISLLIFGCGGEQAEQTEQVKINRFEKSLKPAAEIGVLERLTQDGRCIYPTFAPGDSIIYFRRMLATDEQAAAGKVVEELVKPFGMNIHTKELYELSANYEYPLPAYADLPSLPKIESEPYAYGVNSPDSGIVALETLNELINNRGRIYIFKNGEISQLTFGDISCYLERFSNSGRYLSGIFGRDPSLILIFDLESGGKFRISRQGDMIDYMTAFSSSDKYMVFIRSDEQFELDGAPFGDIWLFRFNN